MKRIAKVISILLIFFISLLIESCKPDCGVHLEIKYNISTLELQNVKSSGICFENQQITTDLYGVEMYFHLNKLLAELQPQKSFFIQNVYAAKCPENEYYPQDTIISIKIFSDQDFGEAYRAGADISDFFRMIEYSVQCSSVLIPFAEYLERYYIYPYTHYYIENVEFFFTLTCFLKIVPDEVRGEHNFTFVVKLSDQRELKHTITTILE
jgi:hypothetical protein